MFDKILFRLRFKLSRKFREKKWKELLNDYSDLAVEYEKLIHQCDKLIAETEAE